MKNSELKKYSNAQLKIYNHRYLKNGMNSIFDRTQEDVARVQLLNKKILTGTISEAEKAEWLKGLKGALNIEDLNRIESNMSVIAGETALPLTTRRWEAGQLPRASDYVRIVENLKKIRGGYGVVSDTPPVPVRPLNTFQKWNDVEKILYDVHQVYMRVKEDVIYCGTEMYAGEGAGLL